MYAILYTLVLCTGNARAQIQNQDQIAQALRVVKELCLPGKQYDLHADTKGNIVIKKLTPGGQGSATFSKREAEGATAIYDEKLRIIADLQARECTKTHILQVLKFIKPEPSSISVQNLGKPKRIDLSGLWLAKGYICRTVAPEEKVRIEHILNSINTTKEKGDECIRSGEVTFRGRYDGTKSIVTVEIQNRYPNASISPSHEAALLEIVSSDTLVLSYRDIKITFERYK